MTALMLRRVRARISAKRKLCQVVDESTLPTVVEADAGRRQNPDGRVLRRNLRNGRRNGNVARLTRRRRAAVLLRRVAKLPVKIVWTFLKFMCIYIDDDIGDELQDDATRMWFRINPVFEDRSYLMVQESVRFAVLM